jgi:superfamily II DNA or RNA helicase
MKPTNIKKNDGAVIISTYQTMSTGANIPKLHYIVLASSTKSFVRLNQSVGRGMRKHESKEKIHIIDIVDDLQHKTKKTTKQNYTYRHFMERLAQYKENGYPISESEIFLEGSNEEV